MAGAADSSRPEGQEGGMNVDTPAPDSIHELDKLPCKRSTKCSQKKLGVAFCPLLGILQS